MSLLVICPTRQRPDGAALFLESFNKTKTRADTEVVLVIHPSDASYEWYKALDVRCVEYDDATTLPAKLNMAAREFASQYDYLQYAADDVRYLTSGWDDIVTGTMRERNAGFGVMRQPGREDLAGHVVIDARIVSALGWFAFPGSEHLYLDDAWSALGMATGSLHRFDDVALDHLHPFFGTAAPDENYLETNSAERYTKDKQAFVRWLQTDFEHDVRTVREALT